MSERDDLLHTIAETIADYRADDSVAPTTEHVNEWVNQFDVSVQLPILREMDHVLTKTYFSLDRISDFLAGLLNEEKLVGNDPCDYWRGVNFLDIQDAGASQKEMLALFSRILTTKCGFSVDNCGAGSHTFVYLDDAIFSGGRAQHDLVTWITNDAPVESNLHVIVIATHQGAYYNFDKIKEARKASGKNIRITRWREIELENRKKYTDSSDVLRPVFIPADPTVQTYVQAMNYPPHLRNAGQVGKAGIFSSDTGRQVLEQEFLKAGVRIRKMCPYLNKYQRPLGNMILDTLGFGSLIVTFRNCPNNAPLALWADDPWYPLFPRKTN